MSGIARFLDVTVAGLILMLLLDLLDLWIWMLMLVELLGLMDIDVCCSCWFFEWLSGINGLLDL